MSEPQPNIIDDIPYCSSDDCPLYDGKRCEAMGARPGHICEPAVGSMAVDLSTTLANHAVLRRENTSLREALERAKMVLQSFDRVGEPGYHDHVWCPACEAEYEAPHESDCALAAALASITKALGK